MCDWLCKQRENNIIQKLRYKQWQTIKFSQGPGFHLLWRKYNQQEFPDRNLTAVGRIVIIWKIIREKVNIVLLNSMEPAIHIYDTYTISSWLYQNYKRIRPKALKGPKESWNSENFMIPQRINDYAKFAQMFLSYLICHWLCFVLCKSPLDFQNEVLMDTCDLSRNQIIADHI